MPPHRWAWAHSDFHMARMAAAAGRSNGSNELSYAPSSTIARTSSGWCSVNAWAAYVPYESP